MAKRKRKRAPGGGRKPAGEYAKRTAGLTMRMSTELRKALERESSRTGRSMSQEAEYLLRNALDFPKAMQRDWKADHHYGLGRAVARIAWSVECSTGLYTLNEPAGRTWLDDPFTAAAVRAAIDILMQGLSPKAPAEMAVPESVSASFAQMPADQAAFYMTPEGVGSIAALSLLDQIKTYDPPPLDRPANTHYSDLYYDIPLIRQKLGLAR